jgi:hypothetical protein
MLCHYLAVRCLLEARELSEALQVLTDAEKEGVLFSSVCSSFDPNAPAGFDDITPNVSHVNWILTNHGIHDTIYYANLHKIRDRSYILDYIFLQKLF